MSLPLPLKPGALLPQPHFHDLIAILSVPPHPLYSKSTCNYTRPAQLIRVVDICLLFHLILLCLFWRQGLTL